MSEKTKKGFHIHEYLIVIFMLLLACVLTYVIPAGEYSTIINEAGKEVVDPNGFHFIENTPVNPILMLNLIFRGFVKQAKLIFTMFFIAGGVQMIIDTESIHALMRVLATKFSKTPRMTIIVMMIAFGIMSVPIQMNYFIPFSTVVLMLCLMMGYDAITAAAVIITSSSFGSSCGMLNISTTAIANEMAGLPLYHGMGFRWVGFVIILVLTIWFVCRYAEKVRISPEKSYCYGIPNIVEPGDPEKLPLMNKNHVLVLMALTIGVIALIIGCSNWKWSYEETGVCFFSHRYYCVYHRQEKPKSNVCEFCSWLQNYYWRLHNDWDCKISRNSHECWTCARYRSVLYSRSFRPFPTLASSSNDVLGSYRY